MKENNLLLTDERCPNDKILFGGKISLCYTLKNEDVFSKEKPSFTPFIDNISDFSIVKNGYLSQETGATLNVKNDGDALIFDLNYDNENLSEVGINLPFNFMGKLSGDGFQNQFLFSSPFITNDRKYKSFYLTKPNGNNLLIAVLSDMDGWKMDYSSHSFGHFFINLKLLLNFDKAYKKTKVNTNLKFAILPVTTYQNALEKLSKMHSAPFLYYDKSGGQIGEKINLTVFGNCDYVTANGKKIDNLSQYEIDTLGETQLTPYFGDVKGASVTVYGYDNLVNLFKRSMDSVDFNVVMTKTDGNLCEHQCWATATLRFLLNYKDTLNESEVKIYEEKVKKLLDIVTCINPNKALNRITIFKDAINGYPPYNVYNSTRIQEAFFGVTLLLDAYKYFHNELYLEYACNTLDTLINHYRLHNGAFVVPRGDKMEDYTTVTCPIIPIIDMANFLKDVDKKRSLKYFLIADETAKYLYNRGLVFPTEGENKYPEMEDGSISCTALSLLYYCRYVKRIDKYILKAKEILDLHESFISYTPICQMNRSTLRWWETIWEGDADGPALCCGHAWTIWRAEADYHYYYLTNDQDYLIKARNGFMTNLSKIQANGDSYAIYNADDINGGGINAKLDKRLIRIAPKFPDQVDCGLSRYVFIRLCNTFIC